MSPKEHLDDVQGPSLTMPSYDPYAYEMHEDPYPTYRDLRDMCPAYQSEKRGFWVLSRYEDVQAALRDWKSFTTATGTFPQAEGDSLREFFPAVGKFLDMDPPRHDQLQALVREPFSPRSVRSREPGIKAVATELIDSFSDRGTADLAREFARPLPVIIIADILGIPRQDQAMVGQWSLDIHLRTTDDDPVPDRAMVAGFKMRAYFLELIAHRRIKPQDDVVSKLVAAEVDGKRLSDDELLGMLIFLFLAGNETTSQLIGSLLLFLGQHPAERQKLIDDPSLIATAVEEMLRFEAPVTLDSRSTTRDVELHGQVIRKGSEVLVVYGSANRDERVFENPDAFDLGRPRKRHLAFGDGVHSCLGAPLARVEARIAVEELLARIPAYRVTGPIERYHTTVLRGMIGLPVEF